MSAPTPPPCPHGHIGYCGFCAAKDLPKCPHGHIGYCGFCADIEKKASLST